MEWREATEVDCQHLWSVSVESDVNCLSDECFRTLIPASGNSSHATKVKLPNSIYDLTLQHDRQVYYDGKQFMLVCIRDQKNWVAPI